MLISKFLRRRPCLGYLSVLAMFLLFAATLHAQRLTLNTRTFSDSTETSAVDAGLVPASQPLSLTVRLAPTPERKAALDQFLADQVTPSSPNYHHWLTPPQFAASYGATDDQLAAATTWLQSQGLAVQAISPAKTRLAVSGTAAQVQSAFSIVLRRYQVAGTMYFANTTQPSLPQEVASIIAGVRGLDDMPVAAPKVMARLISASQSATPAPSDGTDALGSAAAAIDANNAPILTLNTTECSNDLAQADYDAYRDLFRQASAQGITVLAASGCSTSGTGSFPASLSEVTAFATSATVRSASASFVGIDPRPSWQYALGLPDDSTRQEPDLTTTSADAFAQALTTIIQQNGGRQGNINAILYSLATTPDLYTQPDNAPAGTWESTTGLGVVDLQKLIKVFPRASGTSTTTTLAYSGSNTIGYGTQVVLTASVSPSAFNTANASGTVTFTSTPQGIIGSAPLTGGSATLTLGSLAVGSYTITASYSGDGNYAASTSVVPVSITVNIVNATLVATLSPSSNVPYGSTGTVTATVALPNSSGAPAGTVSATIEAVTGALFTATLSPNPGGNTATANIVVNAPAPNSKGYTVEVACQGNTNFQCQTPVDLIMTTVLGNTITTMNVSPSAPQAGQPVTLTAIINNSGNGTGTYTFSGNVTFYDNGAQIATAAVATNQATTNKTLAGNIQHSIVAKYSGDANWNPSTSAPQSVSPSLLPATMTLTSNVSTALAGVNLVFTATVFTTVTNTVGPTGNVTFYDTYNGTAIQLGNPTPLTPNGPNESIARLSTTGLLAGGHSVYAVYGGDANFGGATSTPLAIAITDYNLTMVPQTITLQAGQTGQVVMLLGLVGGFNGTVSFGCTPPANAEITCSFNPVTLAGGGSTTMSIVTTAATVATTSKLAQRLDGWGVAAGPMLATLFFLAVPGRRRRLPTMLLVLFALGLTANIGCSKAADPPTVSDPGTPLGTQIFTITTAGTDGVNSVRHSFQYQITIQ
ncbi:Ig-like domain-containing protein [Edaphobacter aggregans]|uniref:Ig-like domain-containing protein n=1 Tax=Edaphobacter aggregans TaxID=570835 RepID=A0A428MPG9_9BACT|nr:Ig-like domain repeat protein [Edaphobacter aggregans]RSL18769.1 Ig-like domain-containing protein [Edaphobacter aggregans]